MTDHGNGSRSASRTEGAKVRDATLRTKAYWALGKIELINALRCLGGQGLA
jgi:hypothetical protein